jgi:hypothetical protein
MKTREQYLQHAEDVARRRAERELRREERRRLDTAPPQDAADWWRMHDERVQQIIEAALEVEREKLVEIVRTTTDFVEKTVAAMDRMKADIDKMFDTLQRATGDGAASTMQRQRMQAH